MGQRSLCVDCDVRSIPGLADSGLLTRERPRVAALLNGVRKDRSALHKWQTARRQSSETMRWMASSWHYQALTTCRPATGTLTKRLSDRDVSTCSKASIHFNSVKAKGL